MKILLINPPFSRLKGFKDIYFPIGLGYLAAILKENGFTVKIYNAENPYEVLPYGWSEKNVNQTLLKISNNYVNNLENEDHIVWREIKETIEKYQPGIVGISVMSAKLNSALKVASICKRVYEDCYVVLGGPHPTAQPEETIRYENIDCIVRGEGEQTLVELCKAISNGNKDFGTIEGLLYKKNGKIIHNRPGELIKNLDELPFPTLWARDLSLYPERYTSDAFGHIITSRGCPFRCAFCEARIIWTRKVRAKSTKNIIKEIKCLMEYYGIKNFYFWDDCFTVNREKVVDLCNKILDEKLKITWGCTTRVNLVDGNLLKLMKNAGCTSIDFGIESGSEKILKLIKKDITLDQVKRTTDLVVKSGLTCNAFFMIGFPEETEDDIKETIKLINGINASRIAFSVFTPYPGCELFEIAKKLGLIPEKVNWSKFSHQSPDNYFVKYIDRKRFKKYVSYVAMLIDAHNNIPSISKTHGDYMSPIKRGIRCFKEHGTIYTIKRTLNYINKSANLLGHQYAVQQSKIGRKRKENGALNQKRSEIFSVKSNCGTASQIRKVSNSDPVIDKDERFRRIYDKCKQYTMTSKERMYALYKSVEYIIHSKIPGDFVECGVWSGGSTMLIAYTLLELNATNRKIYLYDTFEGMSEPTEDDYSVSNKSSRAIDKWKKEQKEDYNEWCYASLSEVKRNMTSTKYPGNNIIFIKGKVEETIPKTMPSKIAILRLDTDWYESTKHELIHLFPLVSKNGVLIIDDYGYWAGSKKAVEEYFSNKSILLNRIDSTGRIGIKIE